MVSLIISSSASPLHLTHSPPPTPPAPPSFLNHPLPSTNSRLTQLSSRHRSRGLSLVTRAVPGTSTYIFAFVFPLSLMAATVFTAIQISDKVDRQFLEELTVNQAILEAAEDDDEDEDGGDDDEAEIPVETETARPRSRNRPKREAEV